MRRLLIADMSEDSASLLADYFKTEYEINICCRGDSLADALQTFRPDLLLLDLMMPVMDGFEALLRSKDFLPPVILATTPHQNDYVIHRAMELGVGHILIRPCAQRAIREALLQMVWFAEHPHCQRVTPNAIAVRHLEILGFVPGNEGYQQLRIGIPILAQDLSMALGKELYPAICQRMENGNPRTVEHNIRTQIKAAWNKRDAKLWEAYFPQCTHKPPTNGEFLFRVALLVEEELSGQMQLRPLETTK